MSESENVEGLLPEDHKAGHLSVLNKSSLQQLKLSYRRSNIVSQTILEDVWSSNQKLFNDEAVNQILGTAKGILQNVDTSNMKTWKSSITEFPDPVMLLERSLPTCNSCGNTSLLKMPENFNKNPCQCNLGLKETVKQNKPQSHNSSSRTPFKRTLEGTECAQNMFVKNLISEDSSVKFKSVEDKSFRSKFRNKQIFNETTTDKTQHNKERQEHSQFKAKTHIETAETDYQSTSSVIDLEEEENRAHKSNVAKITFKTAKEQLLASNPAAKRSLGASRRAQAKFVSPMIGAQDKQENAEPTITDDRLKHVDPKMVELIESEIIDKGTPIGWDDIAGLELPKSVIQEAVVWPLLRPDIFTGLRRPPKGILLFGPPGTGKTLIGKCVAAQCNATFFSISASSLTSKWIGDGEKMVRALFAVAACHQPAVIFIDEIDSLLTQRSDSEHEATRRIKTEFLVQFDGAATAEDDRLLIVGATNRPQELDEAARRRLVKRLYIPLPDVAARKQIITNLLRCENNDLSGADVEEVAGLTEGYSGADMKSLCSEAAMGPVRAVPLAQIATIHRDSVRPVSMQDFINALQRVRPSVSPEDLGQYVKWNLTFGQGF